MRRSWTTLAVSIALVAAACGGGGEEPFGSQPSDPPGETTTSVAPPTTRSPVDPSDVGELRRFEVDGAEVWTRSALEDLPESASAVSVSVTVIDSGDGPEACFGGVAESLPPQCGGPIVDGLDMDGWSQSAQGVSWGDRNLVVAWPPVDGHLELLSDAPFDPPVSDDRLPQEIPAECADIGTFVDVETLAQWADANSDRAGVVSVVDGGRIGVLRAKGDLESVRQELTDGDAQPCLIQVEYSTDELRTQQEVLGQLFDADVYLSSTGSGNMFNQVTVDVVVADITTVRAILELVDDPGIVRISGLATILEGT